MDVAYGLLDDNKGSTKQSQKLDQKEGQIVGSVLPVVVVNVLDCTAYLCGPRRGKYVPTYGS